MNITFSHEGGECKWARKHHTVHPESQPLLVGAAKVNSITLTCSRRAHGEDGQLMASYMLIRINRVYSPFIALVSQPYFCFFSKPEMSGLIADSLFHSECTAIGQGNK